MQFGIGLVGAGVIGKKRSDALPDVSATLVAVADKNLANAKAIAEKTDAEVTTDWREVVKRNDVQLVIVATSNDALCEVACGALEAGKHVLVEKPGARSVAELKKIAATAERANKLARIGFNHRFHPAIWAAKSMATNGEVGDILYFRARYGHGGRIGYEKEWRANPDLSGGGELIDQGVHLVDLCRWMGGEFDLEFGRADTMFWKMPVDDNAFLFLKGREHHRYAWLHASCTEWKNTFNFEIYGTTGKIEVVGLGGSYGEEMIQVARIDRERGFPKIETESFAGEDVSWRQELKAFRGEIAGRQSSIATLEDGIRVLELVEETYRQSPLAVAPAPKKRRAK
ncbi:MAG: Gfo/Idh/MocA family oxidoreductase [Deltaproteobacteria bacterium]|nr:Gfo/Idh/MocA family oxidoreductase [Deltaproteobacteria bacterium]MBI3293396.1 Gfo/Idh/MocA family oxidoreductase [Deltaproteobacteria bacterium]